MTLTRRPDPMAIHNLLNDTPSGPEIHVCWAKGESSESKASTRHFTPVSRDSSFANTPASATEEWSSESSGQTPASSPEPVVLKSTDQRSRKRKFQDSGPKTPRDERPEYTMEERDFLWFCKIDLGISWDHIRAEFREVSTSDPKRHRVGKKTAEGSLQCKMYRLADTINKAYGEDPKNPGHPKVPDHPIIKLDKERDRKKTLEARMIDGIRGRLPEHRYKWMPGLAYKHLGSVEATQILRWPTDNREAGLEIGPWSCRCRT